MRPRRKNISYRPSQPNPTYTSKIPVSVKQTSSIKIQTDSAPAPDLCPFDNLPEEKMRENYEKCLLFINKSHEHINSLLKEEMSGFSVPNVPNYFKMLDFVMKWEDIKQLKSIGTQAEPVQENAVDLQQLLYGSIIGDGPNKRCPFLSREPNLFDKFSSLNDQKHVAPISLSQPIIINLSEHNNKKSVSTTFEDIIKTCNEVKNMSIESLLQSDVPLKEPEPKSREQKDENTSAINIEEFDYTDSDFNLFEYARKRYTSNDEPTKPLKMLNESNQSHMPQRVNEMFRKISSENIVKPEQQVPVVDTCHEQFARPVQETRLGNRNFVPFFMRTTRTEHEQHICLSENLSHLKSQSITPVSSVHAPPSAPPVQVIKKQPPVVENENIVTYPLKLSERDKARANKKALKDIGIFNDKGDVRPSIINIIKMRQHVNNIQHDSRNMKFKSPRKFDLRLKFNNPNASANTSSEEKLETCNSQQGSDEDLTIYSSRSTVRSTISDSDFIGLYDVCTSVANTRV